MLRWIRKAQTSRVRLRSIGFKLFLAFLVSIVASFALSGWLVYSISAQALKEKVGNNADQVTRDAAKQVDLWERQMEGVFNNTVIFAVNNQALTEKRRKLLPDSPVELAEYERTLQRLAAIKAEIEKVNSELKPNTPKPIALTRLESEQTELLKKSTELNKLRTEADKAFREYMQSSVMTNSDMVFSSSMIRHNGDDQIQISSITAYKAKANPYQLPLVQEAVAAKGKVVFSKPQKGSFLFEAPETVFAMARAFWSPEDLVWADVIVTEFKLSYFEKMLSPITFGGIGEIHLIGQDGTTYFTNRPQAEFGDPAAVKHSPNQDTRIADYTDAQGNKYLLAGTTLRNQPWTLIGAIPETKLLEDAQKILERFYYLLGGSVIAACLLGWWGYLTFGKPMIIAQRKMQLAEQGDLGVRLQFRRSDEIGSVGTSFDSMMDRINGIVGSTSQSANLLLHSTEEIRGLVESNESASREIASTMNEISIGASNLASDAEKSGVLIGKLHQCLNDVIEKNTHMMQASEQMEAASHEGLSSMQVLSEQSQIVEAKITDLNQKMERLRESTQSISVVMDFLQSISKRINILSLNAGIVAASSGKTGKGFMVIAGEIRNLAVQSHNSIESAGQIIERIHSYMEETSELVSESMPIFRRQLNASDNSQEIFQKVMLSMQQFAERFHEVWGSLQISVEAGQELNEMLLQVSALSEQFTASTEGVAGLVDRQYHSSNRLVETTKALEALSAKLNDSLKGFAV
ncbi:methyl-accepting chemotaxis protein [Paenibacillus sp. GD4]|uniref:methyl-accepting chemotaxis protein n=1 Tax=Paenibacillus sp. GD4 TaxID=3068890 RepID=UPI0027968045|nr:methyl-accepting chemotaxis protein [Paenibacillus sp. GD4]MDQ1913787.1 methyl-accepting chemotaxis protein [Paenibacillus sp. GD4]